MVLFFAAIGHLTAQSGFRGKIVDENNRGIPLATIYVEEISQGTASDVTGAFEMTLPEGTYHVTISSVGFKTWKKLVTVRQGMNDPGKIILRPSQELIDEIVVTTSRRPEKITRSPATINFIPSRQLENFAGSPEEVFALQKGVDFSRTGSFWGTISVRGFNSSFNQKLLLLDDNRISHVRIRTPVGPMSAFVKEDIERVEIVLGPSSALYGPNSLNALINTLSKSPFTYPGTTLVIGSGSNNLLKARVRHARVINPKWAYKLTSEYISGSEPSFTDSVYIPGSVHGKPEIGLNRDVSFIKLLAAGFYKPSETSEIGINYAFNRNNSMNGARNNLKDWDNSALQFTYKSPQWFAQLYKTWIRLGSSVNTHSRSYNYYTLVAQGQTHNEAFTNSLNGPRKIRLEEDSYRYNGEIQYNHDWKNLSLVMGTQYQKEHAFSNHTYLIDDDGPIILNQYGSYIHGIFRFGVTGWELTGAVRADYHSLFGFNFLPKAGITKSQNGGTWRLTFGEGYLVPTLINTHQNGSGGTILGNAEGFTLSDGSIIEPLEPETIRTLEIGYKSIRFNQKLYVDANAYFNWSENLISPVINIAPDGRIGGAVVTHRGDRPIEEFTLGVSPGNLPPGALIMTNINFGNVQTYGFDMGLKYYLSDNYLVMLNYSYFDYLLDKDDQANDANRDGKVTDNDLAVNTPQHKISSAIQVNYLKFQGTLFSRWIEKYDFFSGRNVASTTYPDRIYNGYPVIQGKRVGDQFNNGPLGGFYMSVNAGYQVTSLIHAGFYVNNILGKGNYEYVSMAPTRTTWGIELKFTVN